MTRKPKPNSGKLVRFQTLYTRAHNIITNVGTASTVWREIRIKIIRGHVKTCSVRRVRDLSFGQEKKVRFGRRKVMFDRMEIRGEASDITKVDSKR